MPAAQKYYPYGRPRGTETVPTDKLFTGHQKEGDLYFMQARSYDTLSGRFLSADTIVPDPANPQSLNRYSYVYNNPLAYTDRTGRCGVSLTDPGLNNLLGLCGGGVALTYPAQNPVHEALGTVGQSPGSNCPPLCEDIMGSQYRLLEEDTIAAYDTLEAAGLDPASFQWSLAQVQLLIAHEYPVDVSIYPNWLRNWYRAAAYAYVGHLISSAADGYQIEGSAARLARGGRLPVLKGQAFEARASAELGLLKNTKRTPYGDSYVVFDFIDAENNIFYEAKNMGVVGFTKQIQIYVDVAEQQGGTLVVAIPSGSRPSTGPKGLLAAQEAGLLDIRYIR